MCDSPHCKEEIKRSNEARETNKEKAQELANQTGEWFAVYQDEKGAHHYIRADQAQGYPIQGYVSPKL